MCSRTVVAAAFISLAMPWASSAEPKPKRPVLDMRVSPRMAFSPVNILAVAEMKGGDDIEEFYCPEIEWDWDDGGKSVHEADCDPFEPGTAIERRFSQEHAYRRAGIYNVKATFKKAGRTFLAGTIRVTVRPGVGDRSNEPPQ